MRKCVRLFLVSLSLCLQSAFSQSVLNPGFENGVLSPWQGWGISVGSQTRTENYGLTQNPSSGTDVAYQDVYGLVSGQTYVVSAWVRCSSATSNQVALAVANGASWMQNVVTPGTGWQQVSQSFTVASDGWMRIHLYHSAAPKPCIGTT